MKEQVMDWVLVIATPSIWMGRAERFLARRFS
jgi:hypothetical protein